jgi:hypothetical protein
VESDALDAADMGIVAYKAFYDALHRDDKALLRGEHENLKSIAAAADMETERRRREAVDADVPEDPFERAEAPATDGLRLVSTPDPDPEP